MELTKEQIQRVNKYLNVKGVKFIDFRVEVFDHIVSQIEQKLEIKNTDFETVFYQVTDEWNKQLNSSSSFIFGLAYSAPKIVMNKAKKVFKPFFFFTLVLCILPGILMTFLDLEISPEVVDKTSRTINIIALLLSSVWLFTTIKTNEDKIKTVYSFIIKTQSLTIIYVPLMVLTSSIKDGLTITLFLVFVSMVMLNVLFYKKHLKEKEKYKLLVG